ncbi:MAG: calcium-binding protein, partial [Candidatus Hydrogenedentes bacterium]|nr:calcium-binding protein [Candidatus Hydrogenedentota bacterium]
MTAPCGFEEFTGTPDVDIVDWSSATVRVSMRGNGGADMLLAGNANDDLVTLSDPVSGAVVNGGGGFNDTLLVSGPYSVFTLVGSCGFENFTGGDGNDNVDWSDATVAVSMRGNGGDDTLTGGAGADLITGGNGNDVLYGNGGADTLYGEGGINHLTGGPGNDSLRGGGSDYAHYSATPVPPRYQVRNAGTYYVVTDITGGPTGDGVDIVRGCPVANIVGPYTP